MTKENIQNLWSDYSSELQEKLNTNTLSLPSTDAKTPKTILNGLLIRRILESLLFLVFSGLLLRFSIENNSTIYYVLSGLILMIFCLVGLTGSLMQIILILRLDFSKPITSFQAQLEKLKIYSLQTLRLIFLSIPFYSAYMVIGFKALYDFDILANADSNWLIWNIILTILFIPFSIWLYKILNYKTKKRWVKKLIVDNGGKQIHSAIQFLHEIEEFEKNGTNN